jgi:hypothetical protein
MLVAILAMGLAVASVASAAPEFTPTGATVTGTSGVSVLTAGTNIVTCQKDTLGGGKVTSATLVGGITVHYLECVGKSSTGTCPVMSPGAPAENLILTNTLHGVLGLILPETGSGVALVLLPLELGFVTLLGSCITKTTVEGDVAGEVSPVGKSVETGTVTLAVPSGKQAIKDVDLSTGGLIAPKLSAFGVTTATEETTEQIEYSKSTEVT